MGHDTGYDVVSGDSPSGHITPPTPSGHEVNGWKYHRGTRLWVGDITHTYRCVPT